jgi:hypothetical protein
MNYKQIRTITKFTSLNLHATQYRRKIRVYILQTIIQTNMILTKSNDYQKNPKISNLINNEFKIKSTRLKVKHYLR